MNHIDPAPPTPATSAALVKHLIDTARRQCDRLVVLLPHHVDQKIRKVAGLRMDGPLPPWTSDEFVNIAAGQQQREERAARTANRVLFCDTNAFATGTWHERYLGYRSPEVDAIGRRDKVDLYLLAEPDFPFVQDGWRDGELIRDWMHRRFAEQLERSAAPLVRLAGPLQDRVEKAAVAVGELLRQPFDL